MANDFGFSCIGINFFQQRPRPNQEYARQELEVGYHSAKCSLKGKLLQHHGEQLMVVMGSFGYGLASLTFCIGH